MENDADIDKILILNNDILFTDDIMPTLLDVLEQDSSVGVVCPLLKRGIMCLLILIVLESVFL